MRTTTTTPHSLFRLAPAFSSPPPPNPTHLPWSLPTRPESQPDSRFGLTMHPSSQTFLHQLRVLGWRWVRMPPSPTLETAPRWPCSYQNCEYLLRFRFQTLRQSQPPAATRSFLVEIVCFDLGKVVRESGLERDGWEWIWGRRVWIGWVSAGETAFETEWVMGSIKTNT